jgi:AcrR family transcriptional regulator
MRGRKKSEATRVAILQCASSVFSERPYHEVLTDEISTRLGVGKGTLYRYFSSKEELYFATIVHGLQGMRSAIVEVVAPELPLERIIENLTRTVIGYFWERRDFFVLLHRHEPKLDPSERADWQQQREEVVDLVAARLAEEMKRRGVAGLDARLAVEMLFGMIRSVCMYRGESDRIDDLTRQVTQVFLRGVLPAEREGPRQRAAAPRRLRAVSQG